MLTPILSDYVTLRIRKFHGKSLTTSSYKPMMTTKMLPTKLTIAVLIGILATINPAISQSNNDNQAQFGDHPFVVSLRLNGIHFCSGAIIGMDSVLTAAHCAPSTFENVTVVVGTLYWRETDKKLVYGVTSKTYPKPALVIFHLDRLLTYDLGVQPIAYINSFSTGLVDLIGWGSLNRRPRFRVKALSKVKLHTLSGLECREHWSVDLEDSESCGWTHRGGGLCGGDFGAPVVYENKLVGIFQRGDPCDPKNLPIFTRV